MAVPHEATAEVMSYENIRQALAFISDAEVEFQSTQNYTSIFDNVTTEVHRPFLNNLFRSPSGNSAFEAAEYTNNQNHVIEKTGQVMEGRLELRPPAPHENPVLFSDSYVSTAPTCPKPNHYLLAVTRPKENCDALGTNAVDRDKLSNENPCYPTVFETDQQKTEEMNHNSQAIAAERPELERTTRVTLAQSDPDSTLRQLPQPRNSTKELERMIDGQENDRLLKNWDNSEETLVEVTTRSLELSAPPNTRQAIDQESPVATQPTEENEVRNDAKSHRELTAPRHSSSTEARLQGNASMRSHASYATPQTSIRKAGGKNKSDLILNGKPSANSDTGNGAGGTKAIWHEFVGLLRVWICAWRLLGGLFLLWLEKRVRMLFNEIEDKYSKDRGDAPQDTNPKDPAPHSCNLLILPTVTPSTPEPRMEVESKEAVTVCLESTEETYAKRPQTEQQRAIAECAAAVQRTIERLEAEQYAIDNRYPQSEFGRADRPINGSVSRVVQCASEAQKTAFTSGKPLHVRPAMVQSDQTLYLGHETTAQGQEAHRAVMLNADLHITNPALGEPGHRTGHLYAQFYADPMTTKPWAMDVPRVGLGRVRYVLGRMRSDAERRRRNEERVQYLRKQQTQNDSARIIAPLPHRAPQTTSSAQAHYVTHPVDQPPPFDTSNMRQIGHTRDEAHVVLRVDASSNNRTTDPRRRPDTPIPPFVLLMEAPPLAEPGNETEKKRGKSDETTSIDKRELPSGYETIVEQGNEEPEESNATTFQSRRDEPLFSSKTSISSTPNLEDLYGDIVIDAGADRHVSCEPAIANKSGRTHISDSAPTLVAPEPIRKSQQFVIDVSDDSDSDLDEPPELLSTDSGSTSSSTHSIALATHGSSLAGDTAEQEEGYVMIPTQEIVRELMELRCHAPSAESDATLRAANWARTQLSIDDVYEHQARIEAWEDGAAIRIAGEITHIFEHRLNDILDRTAMEKNERFDLEERRRLREEASRARSTPPPVLASLFLDDCVIWITKIPQPQLNEYLLDAVSTRAGIGMRQIPVTQEVPATPRGQNRRVISTYADTRGLAYRTAAIAEFSHRSGQASHLTDVRALTREFINQCFTLIGRRHLHIDIAMLHEPGYPPLPFLFDDENARLRLVQYTFESSGNTTLARIAERLLQHQFYEPEVIYHFLYNGLLDAVDTYPAARHESHPVCGMGNPASQAIGHLKEESGPSHHHRSDTTGGLTRGNNNIRAPRPIEASKGNGDSAAIHRRSPPAFTGIHYPTGTTNRRRRRARAARNDRKPGPI
ncbi:hypothetical protein B0H12DRAFT_1242386 [Mycena haematopus]|nr:hypothetical protein B0H12DRAFT_1242386 [Mycena haematopus]